MWKFPQNDVESMELKKAFFKLYVPVAVHREQSAKKEYQQDAKM